MDGIQYFLLMTYVYKESKSTGNVCFTTEEFIFSMPISTLFVRSGATLKILSSIYLKNGN